MIRHQGWNVKHYTAWYKREGAPCRTTWVKQHAPAGRCGAGVVPV